jgi:crossover junction endodeoxyribonuclease RusA
VVCSFLAAQEVWLLARPLSLAISVYPADRRRRDIDNVQSALLDALQHHGAYTDNSQIVRLSIIRGHPVNGGLTVVQINKVFES